MRKKLFAVIMSAMMMITFMPAMAFAGHAGASTLTPDRWTISGYTDEFVATGDAAWVFYDGTEHTVTYTPATGYAAPAAYTVSFKAVNATTWTTLTKAAVKDAGLYYFSAKSMYTQPPFGENPVNFTVEVLPRMVKINGLKANARTKAYDGEGFALKDADFEISADINGNKTTDKAADKFTVFGDNRVRQYNTNGIYIESLDCGLVAGDTLITKAAKTDADVAEYTVSLTNASINPNYTVVNTVDRNGVIWVYDNAATFATYKATITKAENFVKLPKSNKTYTAKALKKGAKSFALKATAEHGTATITKYEGSGRLYVKNGKLVVKKGTKKGTYKIKVTAHVQGTANYASADVTKTISVKVR